MTDRHFDIALIAAVAVVAIGFPIWEWWEESRVRLPAQPTALERVISNNRLELTLRRLEGKLDEIITRLPDPANATVDSELKE